MTSEQLRQVEAAYRESVERTAELQQQRDDAIRQAAEEGMSTRQIAKLLGLSFQRIAQIVSPERSR